MNRYDSYFPLMEARGEFMRCPHGRTQAHFCWKCWAKWYLLRRWEPTLLAAGEEWESGILVADKEPLDGLVNIYHLALYKVADPTDQVGDLKRELNEDPEFAFPTDTNMGDVLFIVMPKKDKGVLRDILDCMEEEKTKVHYDEKMVLDSP